MCCGLARIAAFYPAQVRLYDAADGTNLGVSFGGYGVGDGRLRFPFSLAARNDGVVMVGDMDNCRVQAFRVSTRLEWLGSTCNRGPTALSSVAGMCIGNDPSHLWVCDRRRKRLRLYSTAPLLSKLDQSPAAPGQDRPQGVQCGCLQTPRHAKQSPGNGQQGAGPTQSFIRGRTLWETLGTHL